MFKQLMYVSVLMLCANGGVLATCKKTKFPSHRGTVCTKCISGSVCVQRVEEPTLPLDGELQVEFKKASGKGFILDNATTTVTPIVGNCAYPFFEINSPNAPILPIGCEFTKQLSIKLDFEFTKRFCTLPSITITPQQSFIESLFFPNTPIIDAVAIATNLLILNEVTETGFSASYLMVVRSRVEGDVDKFILDFLGKTINNPSPFCVHFHARAKAK